MQAYASLYLNSALNPIIYAFRSPSFREGYKEILCQTPTYVISDGKFVSFSLPLSFSLHRFFWQQWYTSDTSVKHAGSEMMTRCWYYFKEQLRTVTFLTVQLHCILPERHILAGILFFCEASFLQLVLCICLFLAVV